MKLISMTNKPVDPKLYSSVKRRVKKNWKGTWPSVYGSAHLVREYKKSFKKKYGIMKSPYKNGRRKGKVGGGLDRWFKEKWMNVCDNSKCGRKTYKKKGKYPYCRPTVQVNSSTPKTKSELTKTELKKLCSKKQKVRGRKKVKS